MRVTKAILERKLQTVNKVYGFNLELNYREYYGYSLKNGDSGVAACLTNQEMYATLEGMLLAKDLTR